MELTVFKPRKVKYLDVLVPILGVDIEFRDFQNSLSVDSNGIGQDTVTPQVLIMLMGMKKKNEVNYKTIFMILSRFNESSSDDQSYLDLRYNIKASAAYKKWEHSFSVGRVQRYQDNYQGQSREDDRIEFQLTSKRELNKYFSIKGFLKYEDQRSNLSNFVYDNRSMGLSLVAKL